MISFLQIAFLKILLFELKLTWRAFRFDRGLQPRDSVATAMNSLNAKAADLSKTVAEIRNRRDGLRAKLGMEIPSADSRPIATPSKVL